MQGALTPWPASTGLRPISGGAILVTGAASDAIQTDCISIAVAICRNEIAMQTHITHCSVVFCMADAMRNVTVRLRDETVDDLDDEADEQDVSRSEYIREILDDRHKVEQLTEEVERLQERLESRENRIDELEEQLARRSQVEEKVDTLAKQQDEADAPFFVKWYRWWQRQQ